jgi:hypothetical protein
MIATSGRDCGQSDFAAVFKKKQQKRWFFASL